MTEYRAADLPEGSVVALNKIAWIKGRDWWHATGIGSPYLDSDVDQRIDAGAQVLRVGTGEE